MRKCFILTAYVILLFLLPNNLNVCASTTYGFETENLSENEINQIWQNINVTSSPDSVSLDSIRLPIVSFDVSENGMILLGFKENKVAVIDENKVLNFFQFSNDGSFYVQWKDNNILLLLVRGSIIVEFSLNGQLVNMIQADDSSTQNNTLWNQIAKKDHVNIGEVTYCVKNDMGLLNIIAPSYSQLVKTDADGNMVTIYDVSSAYTTKFVTIFIAMILFVVFVVLFLILQFKKLKQR